MSRTVNLLGLSGLSCLLLLAACQSPGDSPTPDGSDPVPTGTVAASAAAVEQHEQFPDQGMPQSGGQLRIHQGGTWRMDSLSFVENTSGGLKSFGAQVYDNLVEWDWASGEMIYTAVGPGVADSWDTSADGLVWTFYLRDDVVWHDGTPFTADDVVATIQHYITPPEAAGRPPAYSQYEPYIASIEAPDAHTVVMTLNGPTPTFLHQLANSWGPIVPQKYLEDDFTWFRDNAIGTGPFKFASSSWERGVSFILERNDDFWKDGLPYLDSIQMIFVGDRATQSAAFEAKRIDGAQLLSINQANNLKDRYDEELDIVTGPGGSLGMYILNTRKPPFDDPRVRRAVYLWLDRQQFIEGASRNAVGHVHDWIDPSYMGDFGTPHEELLQNNIAYDPDKTAAREEALSLLSAAGLTNPGSIQLNVLDNAADSRGGQIMVAQLREMGFDAQLDARETLAVTTALNEGGFDVGFAGHPPPYFGVPDYHLNRGASPFGSQYYAGLRDEEFESLINAMNTTIDPAERNRIIGDIDEFLQQGTWSQYPLMHEDILIVKWSYLNGRKWQSFYDDSFDRVWLGPEAPGRG